MARQEKILDTDGGLLKGDGGPRSKGNLETKN